MPRPKGTKNNPTDKPFKTALLMELADAGDNHKSLRRVAAALITKATTGDTQAIREVADRVDGKVPQAVIGDADADPIMVSAIVRTIVHADNPDS